MKNKKLIQFLESIILLPVIASSPLVSNLPTTSMIGASPQTILLQKNNTRFRNVLASNQVIDAKLEQKLQKQAEAVDAYFKSKNMPLYGMGRKMVEEADLNDLDWRLIPAISARESTGGRDECNKVSFNPFGWGSCKIGFKSYEDAIETVARNLGGNNPSTAKHYDNKTTKQILHAYNPPSIVPRYAEQVMSIMNAIGDENLGQDINT